MRIQNVTWRNFNSYGNAPQSLEFNQTDGELNLLLGSNGMGKSSISEVITFALYGKVDGKKMSDLPNRINGELLVKINIICKGNKITIERGIKPAIFNVWINNDQYDQAGKGNVQEYLETEFYDIPFQVFKNIIVLSIEDFKSFLTMSPGDKRNIIDRLFGFSIINQMRDAVKTHRKTVKTNIKTYEDELNIITESITSINDKLFVLEKENKNDNNNKVTQLKNDASSLKTDKEKIEDKLNKLKCKEDETKKEHNNITSTLNTIISEITHKEKSLALYEKDQCPTCTRPWSSHELNLKDEIKSEIITCKDTEKTLNTELKAINDTIKKIRKFDKDLNMSFATVNADIRRIMNEITVLNKTHNSDEQFKHLKSLLEENNKKQINKNNNKSKEITSDNFLQSIESILGDEGVKNLAVKTILPSLNANISKMVAQMHLTYSIYFDEKFNCIITHLGEKISAKTLSSGQRKKTDFIIIIALIRLMKLRYPELNLLFLDELLSSVDSGGRHEILKILRETVVENKLNAWVINHSELPIELFDKKGEAYIEGGFSKFDIETLS